MVPVEGSTVINPRHACAARVTVVAVFVCQFVCVCVCVSVSVCVCVCVCLLSHISPLELLFIVKTLQCTQWATKVKKFVVFFPKLLHCRDQALPLMMAIHWVCHFPADKTHAHCAYARLAM